MTRPSDIIQDVASLNPIPSEDISINESVERADSFNAIVARLPERPRTRRYVRGRSILFTVALVAILAIPSLAASGRLDSLLDFSNPGTSVNENELALSGVRALDRVGVEDDTVNLLGERAGIALYAVRSATGQLCFGVGPAGGSARSFEKLRCSDFGGLTFPSRELPVADLSVFHGRRGDPNLYLGRLVGVAADGVAEVGFLDANGNRHLTPVENNLYADLDLPEEPVAALIALDPDGRVVWRDDRLGATGNG